MLYVSSKCGLINSIHCNANCLLADWQLGGRKLEYCVESIRGMQREKGEFGAATSSVHLLLHEKLEAGSN
jgi:hypothetical protein